MQLFEEMENDYLCLFFFLFLVILYWNTILIATVNHKPYYVTSFFDTCYLLQLQDYPDLSVLRRKKFNHFTTTIEEVTAKTCANHQAYGTWTVKQRPLIGDHIHLQMVLSVNNYVYNFHDRNMSEPIPYEVDKYPVTCSTPMDFSYEKRWYHTGVHTHCDGNIVHVHPWSAPNQLRVEGFDVKLKLWFESVGIEVATNRSALKLPHAKHYRSDWTMEYYVHVNDENPSFVTTNVEEMINLWLVDHHGGILLWSGGEKPEMEYTVLNYPSHPVDYPQRRQFST